MQNFDDLDIEGRNPSGNVSQEDKEKVNAFPVLSFSRYPRNVQSISSEKQNLCEHKYFLWHLLLKVFTLILLIKVKVRGNKL